MFLKHSLNFVSKSRPVFTCHSIFCKSFQNSIKINKSINNSQLIRSLNKSVIIGNNANPDCNQIKNNNQTSVEFINEKINVQELTEISDRDLIDFKEMDALDKQIDNEYLDEISPPLPVSFNLSAFANRSETIQNFIKLGVDLSEIENKSPETAQFLLGLDFDKDIKPYINFLIDHGVKSSDLGHFITKNPVIFREHFDDLNVRINYLKSKRFTNQMITQVISKAPNFLSRETKYIDSKLGFLQKEYELTGDEVRLVVVSYPRIALLHGMSLRETSFMFKEEFGFTVEEVKEMLLKAPVVWRMASKRSGSLSGHKIFVQIFDYIHNEMKIPHELICKSPQIFNRRLMLIKPRHLYLKTLGRDQYDPKQPMYVPLTAFYLLEDNEFCEKYTKTSVKDFNQFCKTL